VVRQYFEDMFEVWREQLRILDSGATAVCVVANSTFSRRDVDSRGVRRERWRLPILTDVVLAHLALKPALSRLRFGGRANSGRVMSEVAEPESR
jgi:hypothetical protein